MRVLVIGASGQLGQALRPVFERDHEVIEAGFRHAGPQQRVVDLSDQAATLAVVADVEPQLVIIAGAHTHVEGCEADPDHCGRVNVAGPAAVAEFARDTGARVVYYSTDYIFDGTQPSYGEDDPVTPLNAYGQSKAQGEAAVRCIVPERHLILRTSWVYGPDLWRRNFVLRLVDTLSREGPAIRIPSDQWGNPTFTEDLAAATHALVSQGHRGTFHATGPEPIDRASLALRICNAFGLDVKRVAPMATEYLNQVARRPLRVLLRGDKLAATQLASFRDIDAGLQALRRGQVAQ